MTNPNLIFGFAALAVATMLSTPVLALDATYLRKGTQPIKVQTKGGKLYCTRKSDGFEMCHGMTKSGGSWTGGNMKHPDMPGIMTFNGTVVIGASSLNIKGCAIGQSFCDSETWTKKKKKKKK